MIARGQRSTALVGQLLVINIKSCVVSKTYKNKH